MFYTYAHDGPNIILGMVRQDDWHTSGTFDFENVSGERQQAKDVTLRGVKRGGDFWPYVRCEARRKDSTAWERVGESWVFGWPATLVVKAESKPIEFSVRLDVFEDLVGKYEFGRIVLSSGDTSQFLLEDLTAPNTQSSNHVMDRTADRFPARPQSLALAREFPSSILKSPHAPALHFEHVLARRCRD